MQGGSRWVGVAGISGGSNSSVHLGEVIRVSKGVMYNMVKG